MVSDMGFKVNPKKDLILVDGKKIKVPDAKEVFWIIFNKPKDVITTMSDTKYPDRQTIFDFVPKAKELRLLPVGGLDRDATGITILTNDNGWIHPLTHPSFNHLKLFEVTVQGLPSEKLLETLRGGILLPDEKEACAPCLIDILSYDTQTRRCILSIQLQDTRCHHIPRLMEVGGLELVSFKLVQFGPVTLGGLRRGQWREMTVAEISGLKESCTGTSLTNTVTLKLRCQSRLDADHHTHRAKSAIDGPQLFPRSRVTDKSKMSKGKFEGSDTS